MANINKKMLSDKLAEKRDLTKKEASEIVNDVFDLIIDELKAGNRVDITGFGKFEVKTRAARTGVNPQTKEPIEINATKVPGFKASKTLKEDIR